MHASERQGLFNQKEEREGFYEYFDTSDILLDHVSFFQINKLIAFEISYLIALLLSFEGST